MHAPSPLAWSFGAAFGLTGVLVAAYPSTLAPALAAAAFVAGACIVAGSAIRARLPSESRPQARPASAAASPATRDHAIVTALVGHAAAFGATAAKPDPIAAAEWVVVTDAAPFPEQGPPTAVPIPATPPPVPQSPPSLEELVDRVIAAQPARAEPVEQDAPEETGAEPVAIQRIPSGHGVARRRSGLTAARPKRTGARTHRAKPAKAAKRKAKAKPRSR